MSRWGEESEGQRSRRLRSTTRDFAAPRRSSERGLGCSSCSANTVGDDRATQGGQEQKSRIREAASSGVGLVSSGRSEVHIGKFQGQAPLLEDGLESLDRSFHADGK